MAVVDKYVDPNTQLGKMTTNLVSSGRRPLVLRSVFQITAGDSAGSVYRLFDELPANTRIKSLSILNDAITGATDVDFGIYIPTTQGYTGAVVEVDFFDNGKSLATGHAVGAPLVGMTNVALSDFGHSLDEIMRGTFADPGPPSAYDIALTLNTAATSTGYVVVTMEILPEA